MSTKWGIKDIYDARIIDVATGETIMVLDSLITVRNTDVDMNIFVANGDNVIDMTNKGINKGSLTMTSKSDLQKRAYELLECIYLDNMLISKEIELEIRKLFYMTPKIDNDDYATM